MADEPDMVLAHLRLIRQDIAKIDERFGEVNEKLDDNRQATNGVALMVTMLAGHVHHIDERLEAVEHDIRHLMPEGTPS